MESINKFKITLGANVSNSPFCNLHNTCCVRLPAIPKLRLCIWQKWRSHIWLLTRSWINVSPTHNTSGSASLASAQNRLCWNKNKNLRLMIIEEKIFLQKYLVHNLILIENLANTHVLSRYIPIFSFSLFNYSFVEIWYHIKQFCRKFRYPKL